MAMTPTTMRTSMAIIHRSVATYLRNTNKEQKNIIKKFSYNKGKRGVYSEIDLPTNFLDQLRCFLD